MKYQPSFFFPHFFSFSDGEQIHWPWHCFLNVDGEHVRWEFTVQDHDRGTACSVGLLSGILPRLGDRLVSYSVSAVVP